jgi:Na+-transporting NADH:ubiquinone oxidoreductase subunit NqrF
MNALRVSIYGPQPMAFWTTYGTPIVILVGGAVGAFSSLFIDYLKDRKQQKKAKHA